MNNVKIEIITPVHVGSGEILRKGNDYVCGKDTEGNDIIGIVNPEKVVKLIGMEHLDAWVTGIENGRSTDDIVRQYAPKANIYDYTTRRIDVYACEMPADMKEFMHDGLGRPYIPGSSIKGAIRTAVLATIANSMPENTPPIRDVKGKITAAAMEKLSFGDDPKKDVFRFLHVGDAMFGKQGYRTWALCMANINERKSKGFWDVTKKQMVEVLCPEDETDFCLRLNTRQYDCCRSSPGVVHTLPECMSSLNLLFRTINEHTLKLVNEEIDYWRDRLDESDTTAGEDEVNSYIKHMEEIKNKASECKDGKSCILRIGHGSGWRFITGAWTETRKDFDEVIAKSRFNAGRYSDYDFPKSRRIEMDEKDALGFVRLTIIS